MKKFFKIFLSLNLVSITIILIVFVMILFSFQIEVFKLFELKIYDLRLRSRGIEKPSPEVVLAVIDEKSLDLEGQWPWPRSKIARLIDIFSGQGTKVIGFDIFFTEAEQNPLLGFIDQFGEQVNRLQIKNTKLTSLLEQTKINADNDLILAETIKRSKAKVVLAHFFHGNEEELGYQISPEEIKYRLGLISNSRYSLTRYKPEASTDDFIEVYAPESNIEILSKASPASAYVNMFPDEDGVVRWMPLVIKCGDDINNLFMPLSIQSTWQYLDRPQIIVRVGIDGVEGVKMGKRFIPTNEKGQLLINYLGPQKTFPHYSISDILHDKLPKGTFKDKIVLVGATATGIYDLRSTPFSPIYPGLETHATVIDNILNENFLQKPDLMSDLFDVLAIIILGILTSIVLPRVSALYGILFSSGLFVLYTLMSQWIFFYYGWWINIVYPLLTLILVYTALTVYHYLVEEKNKRFLHSTFESYLSPELIKEMVRSETMPELGGEAKIVTAYFTDIQGFSTFSEKLTAHQLVELLNEYLTIMTDILINEGGTLDKYEGDAIIAFLGAPIDLPDHSLRACRVAVNMQNSLLELCEKWRNEKQLPKEANRNTKNVPLEDWDPNDKWPKVVHSMKMRIGVNTGDIVVGNMGSTTRMNYTMMGDAVNLAARLEEGAKQFGIYTAVSEYTMDSDYIDEKDQIQKVRTAVEARFIDNITVVGKTEPVKLYELCAMKGGLSDQEKNLLNVFNKGMQHYLNMEWDAAITSFKESLKIERIPDSKITPSEVFFKRCEAFKENPPVAPGEKWDGVFRMTKK